MQSTILSKNGQYIIKVITRSTYGELLNISTGEFQFFFSKNKKESKNLFLNAFYLFWYF